MTAAAPRRSRAKRPPAGDGSGRFTRKASLKGTLEYALSAADFDNDGDLDLYACNYSAESSEELAQLSRTDPLFDSNTGGRNVLFRNEGEWRFVDATEEVGLNVNNRRYSLAAAWEDVDNDGDVDSSDEYLKMNYFNNLDEINSIKLENTGKFIGYLEEDILR